jgi:hypothetical protein
MQKSLQGGRKASWHFRPAWRGQHFYSMFKSLEFKNLVQRSKGSRSLSTACGAGRKLHCQLSTAQHISKKESQWGGRKVAGTFRPSRQAVERCRSPFDRLPSQARKMTGLLSFTLWVSWLIFSILLGGSSWNHSCMNKMIWCNFFTSSICVCIISKMNSSLNLISS